jgi:hypothetical protein
MQFEMRFAKRWSAVSDGGEDRGAEEALVWGMKKAKNHHVRTFFLEKSPSRASGSVFSARDP